MKKTKQMPVWEIVSELGVLRQRMVLLDYLRNTLEQRFGRGAVEGPDYLEVGTEHWQAAQTDVVGKLSIDLGMLWQHAYDRLRELEALQVEQ